MSTGPMKLTVARIGRAHGLKGEVTVEVRTDIPEDRLAPGEVYETEPDSAGPLTIESVRTQGGRWFLRFEEIGSREAADEVRGVELVIDGDESDEDDAWYVHELVGLTAQRPDGERIGEVVDLLSMPAQDVLVVKEPGGHRAMIPFVDEFVPDVDLEAGTVTLTPPYGLLSGETPEATGETR
ncbi:ribosome maturation factor RimM [Demequina activiva]|uniref:Ribosome maturation factor RimM n=1 Tax=Demequina activiva TaxID=1582364 RepID=A0A919UJ01_9MICO|nr:ribosome maturation factor RimM [Demequina activiva]GIG53260.1 ribosome maturation factor RimM [Demequina activiva]